MNIYFRKSDSRTDDGQKIIGGITEPELTTVDGQKNIGGAKSLVGVQKKWRVKKKVDMKNVGY